MAQGWEAGGHVWGEVSTLALVPRVVDAVAPLPVVAAGGIADGRGLAAVLALGAGAAWMGTRFLLAEEAATHPVYREAVIAADETATAYSSLFDVGWPDAPLRALRNSTWEAWRAAGEPPPGARPGEGEIVATGEDGRDIARYCNDAPWPEPPATSRRWPSTPDKGWVWRNASNPPRRSCARWPRKRPACLRSSLDDQHRHPQRRPLVYPVGDIHR